MISDHTYHRLLNLDWVVADVDGDGRAEYVPQSDRMGATEPKRAYSLVFTEPTLTPKPVPKAEGRFLIGGSIYDGGRASPTGSKSTIRSGRIRTARQLRFFDSSGDVHRYCTHVCLTRPATAGNCSRSRRTRSASIAARMFGEVAIAARGDPKQPDERAPHHVDAAKPGGGGDVLETAVGALELTAR